MVVISYGFLTIMSNVQYNCVLQIGKTYQQCQCQVDSRRLAAQRRLELCQPWN